MIQRLSFALLAAAVLYAADPASSVDLSVPESPAFTVLGVTPAKVIRPSTQKDLAASLLNGPDDQGNFQTGIALDFLPYLLAYQAQLNLADYRRSYLTRFIARTSLSFGTTKSFTGDISTRVATGMRLTIFDKGDPRADAALDACFNGAFQKYLEAPDAGVAAAYAQCVADSRKRNSNRSSWIVAAAPSWSASSTNTADTKWNGAGVWTSLAYGFDSVPGLRDSTQLILHVRYRQRDVSGAPASILGGMQFRVGSPDTQVAIESVYIHRQPRSSFETTLSTTVRVADGVWFTLALSSESGRENGQNRVFILSQFQWGFMQSSPSEGRAK